MEVEGVFEGTLSLGFPGEELLRDLKGHRGSRQFSVNGHDEAPDCPPGSTQPPFGVLEERFRILDGQCPLNVLPILFGRVL